MIATQALVDVVIDVATSQLDEPFTYSIAEAAPLLGARVRVPLGGRKVSGWVVGMRANGNGQAEIKPVEEICDDPAIPADAIDLARWMRRRYACSFRDALSVVAPRGGAKGERYEFLRRPDEGDEVTAQLYRSFDGKRFSALGAVRALRAARLILPLSSLRRRLLRLVAKGVLRRLEPAPRQARSSSRDLIAILEDAARARGAAQRRLAEALADAGGSLPLQEARRRACASAATVRSAVAAAMMRTEAHAGRVTERRAAPSSAILTPTSEQRAAIDELDASMKRGHTVALLQGITGSGKTFVYSRLVDRVRARGGRAVVLVPEISLTPQTAGRFIAAFGKRVGVLHSGLSAAQRASVWRESASGLLDVVVGARSAVFAPLPDLKLIIVDEEHEASYKQDIAPRYDATAVAEQRMKQTGGSVLLGSATPSLESYWAAVQGRLLHVRLTQRATSAPLPDVEIVDMTRKPARHTQRALGPVLVAGIESNLARGEKVLLFVNRRGYAGLLLCRTCGFAPRCRRCAVSLVVHAADGSMRCHVCGDAFRIPKGCPKCGSGDLRPFGFGTQRVEEEVRELFPEARAVRMDSDSTGAQGSHERLLTSFAESGDILIGTQMIAKGLDYPTVTLVGVLAADLDLNRPDFRAAERTFSLLTQVAGRAGRAAPGSRVIVQTYAPEHYAITLAAKHDYDEFARSELAVRRELQYPPFGRISYVIVAGIKPSAVEQSARALADHLRGSALEVEVLGPAPDVLPKARGEYRMKVALKSTSEEAMLAACAIARGRKLPSGVRATVIVDPR